jgi:branched-chain amino acid transport system substrate-binding protein
MSVHGHRMVVAGVLWTFAGLLAGNPHAAAQDQPAKIAIGVAGPMSGQAAGFGQQSAEAARVSVDKINSAGGINGLPVTLVVGDDRCDRGMAVDVAKRHIERDKIAAVVGPACPAAALAASRIYANAGIVQFSPTVTTVDLTRQGFENVFRMLANIEQQAQELGRYFSSQHKGKKLVVVYVDDFYGRSIVDHVRRSVSADAAVRFEPLLDMSGAYDRVVDKLQQDPPDAIYMALQSAPSVEFIKKVNQRGVRSILAGGQQLLSKGFWYAAREHAEGIRVLAPIGSLDDPGFKTASDQLGEAKVVPDLVALSSFAAVQTWAEAARRAGSSDAKAVIPALRSGEFETALGRVAFDQKGDRRDIRYSVLTWKDGRLRRE